MRISAGFAGEGAATAAAVVVVAAAPLPLGTALPFGGTAVSCSSVGTEDASFSACGNVGPAVPVPPPLCLVSPVGEVAEADFLSKIGTRTPADDIPADAAGSCSSTPGDGVRCGCGGFTTCSGESTPAAIFASCKSRVNSRFAAVNSRFDFSRSATSASNCLVLALHARFLSDF